MINSELVSTANMSNYRIEVVLQQFIQRLSVIVLLNGGATTQKQRFATRALGVKLERKGL